MNASAPTIGGYRLVAGLGDGGMARVYLALSNKAAGFPKLVVVKVLRASVTGEPELRRMFLDEARVAALVNHPNVVQTFEAGEHEGRLFLAMEYLEGKSLSAITKGARLREIGLDVHLRIITDMLAGLHAAHEIVDVDGRPLGVIHRDVSPQNVIVTFSGQAKVLDFGIAKIAGSPATESGVIKGKVGYIAPEQIHNKKVDRRADVFSAGVMIWEAIAKRRLVRRSDDEVASIARRMASDDPSVRTVAPVGTSEELLAICEKAMSSSPDDRHATALELHDALDAYLRKTCGADQKSVAAELESTFGDERNRERARIEKQLAASDDASFALVEVSTGESFTLTAPLASTPTLPPPEPASPSAAARPRSRSGSTALGIGITAAIGVAAAGAMAVAAARARPTPPQPSPAREAPVAAAPPASAETATARLEVRAEPESATLLIDDKPAALPYRTRLARGASLRVSARAPGFSDYDRTVTLDEDTNLDIRLSLSPVPAKAPEPGRGADRKKRMIDDGDPYR